MVMGDSEQKSALSRSPQRSWARRFVMPLVILAFAGVLLYIGRGHEIRSDEEVIAAVHELVEEVAGSSISRPAPGPVAQRMNVSTGTLQRLAIVLESQPAGLPGFNVIIESDDTSPPYGDGSATHRAYLAVQGTVQLALRLRHTGDPHRIEVLGYWIPQPSEVRP
jgi:hypothetical protein